MSKLSEEYKQDIKEIFAAIYEDSVKKHIKDNIESVFSHNLDSAKNKFFEEQKEKNSELTEKLENMEKDIKELSDSNNASKNQIKELNSVVNNMINLFERKFQRTYILIYILIIISLINIFLLIFK